MTTLVTYDYNQSAKCLEFGHLRRYETISMLGVDAKSKLWAYRDYDHKTMAIEAMMYTIASEL